MSQLNVNTIGARTGTDITIASGHTLEATQDFDFYQS